MRDKNKKENSEEEENKIYRLTLKLYEEFLEEISKEFLKRINPFIKKEANKSEEKQPPQKSKSITKDNKIDNTLNYYSLIKDNFEFIPYLFEYYNLKNYSNI